MKVSIASDFTDYTWVALTTFRICESETLSLVSLTRLLSRQADFSMQQLMVKLLEVNCMFPKFNLEVFQIALQGLRLHDLNLIKQEEKATREILMQREIPYQIYGMLLHHVSLRC